MSTLESNCVVRAVSWLTGIGTAEALTLLQDTVPPGEGGGPVIDTDGAHTWAYASLLVMHGWRFRAPKPDEPFVIPDRALVTRPGHAFAHNRGKFFNLIAGEDGDEDEILFVLIPPEKSGGEQ